MGKMTRWIFLPLLAALCFSCAEKQDNAYPEDTQRKALAAWMRQNRPELLENYQEDGGYYVDVLEVGDLADTALRETEAWVRYDITGRDLRGNVCITRDSVYALQQGTFTRYTHYVPYFQFSDELADDAFREGVHLSMRSVLKLGEAYAAERGLPREVELRKDAQVVLYMPATIVSTGSVNGDGGYEGQYQLSANHPLIAHLAVKERVRNPVAGEGLAVDAFAEANGRLDPTVPKEPEESVAAVAGAEEYTWHIASEEAAQVYYNTSFSPAAEGRGSFSYANPYVGSQQKADEIDRRINEALVERFGTEEPGGLVDPEKTLRVWYIARFLDGFVQSTNIDEVKRIVYGEVEKEGTVMSYNPSLNKSDQIAAWYYVLPYFRYGQWGALLTTSSNAYGSKGIVGTTQTDSSVDYTATYALMNYYGMMNSYYGNSSYYDRYNYYDNFYGNYMDGLYNASVDNAYNSDAAASTTVVTEVLPFTPLLIEFYIEPEE